MAKVLGYGTSESRQRSAPSLAAYSMILPKIPRLGPKIHDVRGTWELWILAGITGATPVYALVYEAGPTL